MSDSAVTLLFGLVAVALGAFLLVVGGEARTPGLIAAGVGGVPLFIGATAVAVKMGIRDAGR